MGAYTKAYYAKNREKILASNKRARERDYGRHLQRAREYHHAHREEINARRRQHRKDNPEHYSLLRRARVYDLSPVGFKEMYDRQCGRCLVCGEHKKLAVDHDHKTGLIRGLLCSQCNTAIGLLKDSPELMRTLARYVEECAQQVQGG